MKCHLWFKNLILQSPNHYYKYIVTVKVLHLVINSREIDAISLFLCLFPPSVCVECGNI